LYSATDDADFHRYAYYTLAYSYDLNTGFICENPCYLWQKNKNLW